MDCRPDGDLGADLFGDVSGDDRAELLCVALSAGLGGGGIFSRRHPLFEALVSSRSTGKDRRAVHDRVTLVRSHRRTDLGSTARAP